MRAKLQIIVIAQLCVVICAYKAAVVDYYPSFNPNQSHQENILANVQQYIDVIHSVTQDNNNVDIIVFPEKGLHHGVAFNTRDEALEHAVNVSRDANPCHDLITDTANPQPPLLRRLSCAANKHNVYLSVNLHERHFDTKWYLFNSNVVFDRKGRVVSRYRKNHPYAEDFIDPPPHYELEHFESDFDVGTFGVLTCFDVLFMQPSQLRAKNVIFPMHWYAELPFLTALQTHFMLVNKYDINLLSSGIHLPRTASGGSGVYLGRRNGFSAYLHDDLASRTIIADTSIDATHSQQEIDADDYQFWKENMQNYTHVNYKTSKKKYQLITESGLKCKFVFDTNDVGSTKIQYKLVAYRGLRRFSDGSRLGVDICALTACKSDAITSCGEKFDINNDITFNKIEITVDNLLPDGLYYPNALTLNYGLLEMNDVAWNDAKAAIKLTKPCNNLYTFGVFGRYFNDDLSNWVVQT